MVIVSNAIAHSRLEEYSEVINVKKSPYFNQKRPCEKRGSNRILFIGRCFLLNEQIALPDGDRRLENVQSFGHV